VSAPGGAAVLAELARLVEALREASHDGPECRICPICRALAGIRELRPEAVDHLAAAVEELLAAVREFARPPTADPPAADAPAADPPASSGLRRTAPRAASPSRAEVQYIEVTD
jgi:hypothetical protein